MRAMVIDDNRNRAAYIADLLGAKGADVEVCHDLAGAYAGLIMEFQKTDVIVCADTVYETGRGKEEGNGYGFMRSLIRTRGRQNLIVFSDSIVCP